MPPEIHIASAIVYTLPPHVEAVAALLAQMPPIQLHGHSPAGKLVVTLEGSTSGDVLDQVGAIQQLEQVINVALVFQSIEPDEEAGRPVHTRPSSQRSPAAPLLQTAPRP